MFGTRSQTGAGLVVVPFDLPGRDALLAWLGPALEIALAVDVQVRNGARSPHGLVDPVSGPYDDCYDRGRGQYNAYLLLEKLAALSEGAFVLGVTGADLFAPVFKFVMGEGLLQGRAAVISTYRLRPELYGLPEDPDLVRVRLLKEAIHELGHCHGLTHCHEPECPMRAASAVEDIDLRGYELCPACARSLREAGAGA